MATNYGDTIFEGELSPSVTQVNPVVDKSGEYLASGLKSTVDNVNSILFSNDKKAARADAAKNTLFGEIAERVSYYADAREQGVSQDEIMRRLRTDSLSWVANNPAMTEDIYTFQNKLLQENGLAGNITRETPGETGNRKNLEAAAEAGFDVSNPKSMEAWNKNKILSTQLTFLDNEIKAATAEGRLVTAKMQNDATLALHGIVQTGTVWVNDQIGKANKLLASAQDPKSRTAIIQQTKAAVAQQLALIGSTRSASGNAIDTSYLTAGVDNIMKVWEETANGTADLSALETAQKTAETQAYMMALQTDPKLATLIALDKASKFQDPTMIMQLDAAKMSVYNKLFAPTTTAEDGTIAAPSDKPADMIESVQNVGQIADILKSSTKDALNDPNATPEEIKAQADKLYNTIRSVNVYGASDSDAKNFMSVVDLFSDVSVGKFIEKNPNLIDLSVSEQAKQVIQKQYDAVVMPLINEEWQTITETVVPNANAQDQWNRQIGLGPQRADGSAEDMDVTKIIKAEWNGTSLQFVVDDQYATDPNIRGIIKKLNSDVVPAVNRMVRTHAHLTGSTDYEKIYNEQYTDLFIENDANKDIEGELAEFVGGYEEAIPKEKLGNVQPRSDGTGLINYLVEGKPDSYITDLDPKFVSSLDTAFARIPPELQGQILINSGARSFQKQKQLWEAALKKYGSESKARKWVAPPGKSNHNHGVAADLYYATPAARDWMHENAADFGLYFPLSNEPWHVEPIGSRG